MLDGGFIAVKGDFLDVFANVREEIVRVVFKELNEVLLPQ